MDKFDLYKDMKQRTNGTLLIGVVGPVRTGKSTFVRRFMELMVLPNIKNNYELKMAQDELPQAGTGKLVMTSEPKFVPKESINIEILPGVETDVRIIDCVGFTFKGSMALDEDGQERLVDTPWQKERMPFSQAASIGTKRVITEHSNIGLVITSDGSISSFSRESYIEAEKKAIDELQHIGKPFVVILNTIHPYSKETTLLAEEMEHLYHVKVLAINCEQLKKEDINIIMEHILLEFPITEMQFYLPNWFHLLPEKNKNRMAIIQKVKDIVKQLTTIRDVYKRLEWKEECITSLTMDKIDMATGKVCCRIELLSSCYYDLLSELTGISIKNEYELIQILVRLADINREYKKIEFAIESVNHSGYGVVEPIQEEITIEEPTLIKNGNKFGIKLKSKAPSIHMIKADIETEIAPIIGTEEQAMDVIAYMKDRYTNQDEIWDTNIFGKSVWEMVEDGMRRKLDQINEESKGKLQNTMKKVVNDSNGGLVCIII